MLTGGTEIFISHTLTYQRWEYEPPASHPWSANRLERSVWDSVCAADWVVGEELFRLGHRVANEYGFGSRTFSPFDRWTDEICVCAWSYSNPTGRTWLAIDQRPGILVLE